MGCHGELVEPWWAASARTIRQATHDITIKQCKFPLSAQRREGDQRSVVGWVDSAILLCLRIYSPDEASPVSPLFAFGEKRAGIKKGHFTLRGPGFYNSQRQTFILFFYFPRQRSSFGRNQAAHVGLVRWQGHSVFMLKRRVAGATAGHNNAARGSAWFAAQRRCG